LKEVLKRAENWPQQAQDELAEIALEIEAAFQGGEYSPTEDELRAIDEASASRVATNEEIEAAFRSFRRA